MEYVLISHTDTMKFKVLNSIHITYMSEITSYLQPQNKFYSNCSDEKVKGSQPQELF